MTPDELQQRTKQFTLRVVRLVDALPVTTIGRRLGGQLFGAASSVGANYRAARRARSRKEFYSKLCIVVEEVDESAYWLELVVDARLLPEKQVQPLIQEAQELTRIFSATRRSMSMTKRRTRSNELANTVVKTGSQSPNHQIAKSPN